MSTECLGGDIASGGEGGGTRGERGWICRERRFDLVDYSLETLIVSVSIPCFF